MLTALIALIGVILIIVSAFVTTSRVQLLALGLGVFLLGWAVLPMFGTLERKNRWIAGSRPDVSE